MTEATSQGNGNGTGAGEAGDQSGDQNQGGSQQQQQGAASSAGTQEIDLASLPPEQLEKVLENKALWDLPRIKTLREKAANADKLTADQQAAEQKALEEQGKFKELAEKRAAELESTQKQVQKMTVDNALTLKLAPLGVVDLSAALQLIGRDQIKVSETGEISGIDEAIESLKKDKAYLFNGSSSGTQNVGSASNTGNGNGGQTVTKFKRSQLQDKAFYDANRDAILAAHKAGQIEDDM